MPSTRSAARPATARAARLRAFTPGEPWLDESGTRIEAHGGGILVHEGRYWWYGEDHRLGLGNRTGIHAYSSSDLLNWRDEGVVLPKEALPEQYRDTGACERPKVLFNAATGRFVMWMHLDGGDGYTWAEAGVAVADAPQGPFTLIRRGRPIRHDFGQREDRFAQVSRGPTYRDMALLRDDDGRAYVFYASEGNLTMYVARLDREYTWVEEPAIEGTTWARILVGRDREAPAPFKHAGRYHLLTSACTGWGPNPALHATAAHPLGPWTVVGDPCRGKDAETTYRSQPTFVLPAPDAEPGSFIYLADRWVGHQLETSTYVWLPLRVDADHRVRIENRDRWDLGVFASPDAPAPAAPRVRAAQRGTALAWAAQPRADLYEVYRNGEHLGSTAGTRFALPRSLPGRAHAYHVIASALGDRRSPPSKPIVIESPEAADAWLSDFVADSWSQGWGTLRYDLSATQEPLRIGDRTYAKGLGTHAVARIVYRIGGRWARFSAAVGLTPGMSGLAICRVYGDNRLLAESRPLGGQDAPQTLSADLTGVQELVLTVDDAGRGHHYAHTTWGDAKLHAPRRGARRVAR